MLYFLQKFCIFHYFLITSGIESDFKILIEVLNIEKFWVGVGNSWDIQTKPKFLKLVFFLELFFLITTVYHIC